MTLLIFLGVLVSLLVLRSIPNLFVRLALAVPHGRILGIMHRVHHGKIGIALPRASVAGLSDVFSVNSALAGGRLRLALVSSSLLVLAVLVTTAFWTWHSTGLMMLLR